MIFVLKFHLPTVGEEDCLTPLALPFFFPLDSDARSDTTRGPLTWSRRWFYVKRHSSPTGSAFFFHTSMYHNKVINAIIVSWSGLFLFTDVQWSRWECCRSLLWTCFCSHWWDVPRWCPAATLWFPYHSFGIKISWVLQSLLSFSYEFNNYFSSLCNKIYCVWFFVFVIHSLQMCLT